MLLLLLLLLLLLQLLLLLFKLKSDHLFEQGTVFTLDQFLEGVNPAVEPVYLVGHVSDFDFGLMHIVHSVGHDVGLANLALVLP